MNIKIKKNQIFLILFSILVLFMLSFKKEVDYLLILDTMLCLFAITICFKNINLNIFFAFFIISFFVFLVSGDLVDSLFGKIYWLQFSKDANNHAHLSILISLIFILLGYFIKKNKTRTQDNRKEDKVSFYNYSRVSLFLYYFSYCILIIATIEKVIYVHKNGYVAYYKSFSSVLGNISQIGDIAPIALCAFLATMPDKKKAKIPLMLYIVYAITQFLIGQRGAIIYNALFILGYLIYRNLHSDNKEIWIRKKSIIILVLIIPVLIVFLQIYGYIRLGEKVEYKSMGDSLIDFFEGIGASSKVIKAGYDIKDYIPKERFYSLGDTLNYYKYSKLFHPFEIEVKNHTVEYALNSHSFDALVTYYVMPKEYINGQGMGSSFIACLYADLGYIGIAIGSFLYGILFKSISSLSKNNWLTTTMKLYSLLYLMKVPRGSYDSFIGAILNLTFIFTILFIYFCSNSIKGKKEKNSE